MKQTKALELVAMMQAIWPQRELSEASIREYVRTIEDLEADAVLAAIEELRTIETFIPSHAALRKLAIGAQSGNDVPDVDTAWANVKEQIIRIGSTRGVPLWVNGQETMREPEWMHPAVGQAAEAMGWEYLCNYENEDAARAHFIRFYGASSHRATVDQTMTPAGKQLLASLGKIGKELPVEVS